MGLVYSEVNKCFMNGRSDSLCMQVVRLAQPTKFITFISYNLDTFCSLSSSENSICSRLKKKKTQTPRILPRAIPLPEKQSCLFSLFFFFFSFNSYPFFTCPLSSSQRSFSSVLNFNSFIYVCRLI